MVRLRACILFIVRSGPGRAIFHGDSVPRNTPFKPPVRATDTKLFTVINKRRFSSVEITDRTGRVRIGNGTWPVPVVVTYVETGT